MKRTSNFGFGLVALLFLLSLSGAPSTAQEGSGGQLRYQFVDLGTFGGHNSGVNGGSIVINRNNVVVGGADTDVPCPYAPDLPISPGFKWKDGIKTPLPLLPGGCSGFPIAINNHGLIVGVADNGIIDPITGGPQLHAVVWRDGGVLDLGTLGGGYSLAGSVNDHGQIVGVAQDAEFDLFDFGASFLNLPTSQQWRGFVWQEGIMQDLGTLGGPDAAATGDLALNERGDIAGYSFTSDEVTDTGFPTLDSFLWRNGKLHDLGTLGGTITQAFTMNSKSQIVGSGLIAGDEISHAFLWERGHIRDLGSLGGSFVNAGWINNKGEVIGAGFPPGDEVVRGVAWLQGAMKEVGTLDGDDCSDAFVVNDRSQVVGHSFPCATGIDRGYVWQNGIMTDLNDFVPPGSEIEIASAGYISENGTIAAVGRLPNGDIHAVLLLPCTQREAGCQAHHQDRVIRIGKSAAPITTRGLSFSERVRGLAESRQFGLQQYLERHNAKQF